MDYNSSYMGTDIGHANFFDAPPMMILPLSVEDIHRPSYIRATLEPIIIATTAAKRRAIQAAVVPTSGGYIHGSTYKRIKSMRPYMYAFISVIVVAWMVSLQYESGAWGVASNDTTSL